MKNATDILNSLQHKPQFSKLSHYKCIGRIHSLFAPPLQKMVKFAYIKNKTLFFVLNHPAAKQEFDNNIDSIKSALNFYNPPECSNDPITDIKAFVTHTPIKESHLERPKRQEYPERATGNFSINIQDEKLQKIAKTIKTIIEKSNATT